MTGAAEAIVRHFKGDWHGHQGAIPSPGHSAKDRGVNPDQLESLRAALKESTIAVEFVVVPDAGHDWKFWNSQWSRVFQLADAK